MTKYRNNVDRGIKLRFVRAKESRKGRMADALALTGDEGRDKLR